MNSRQNVCMRILVNIAKSVVCKGFWRVWNVFLNLWNQCFNLKGCLKKSVWNYFDIHETNTNIYELKLSFYEAFVFIKIKKEGTKTEPVSACGDVIDNTCLFFRL